MAPVTAPKRRPSLEGRQGQGGLDDALRDAGASAAQPPPPPGALEGHFQHAGALDITVRPNSGGSDDTGGSGWTPEQPVAEVKLSVNSRVVVKFGVDVPGRFTAGDMGTVVKKKAKGQVDVLFDEEKYPKAVAVAVLELTEAPIRRSSVKSEAPEDEVGETEEEIQQKMAEFFRTPLVEGKYFCSAVAFSVVGNAVALGLEADYSECLDCPLADKGTWAILEHIFAGLFVLEICARVYSYGLLHDVYRIPVPAYFTGGGRDRTSFVAFVHWTDTLLVLSRVVDTWILGAGLGMTTNLRLLSLLRIIHLSDFVRVVNVNWEVACGPFRFRVNLTNVAFRELWLLLSGCVDTVKTVIWVALLLLLLTLVVAVFLTNYIGHDDGSNYDFSASHWDRDAYWGTVPRSMYSLFQTLTYDGWYESLAHPVIKKSPWILFVFGGFLCIGSLGLLNLIVGVVVESTLASASTNEEKDGREKTKMDGFVMDSLQGIFEEADRDQSGDLDFDELQRAMRRQHVKDRMKLLEINVEDLELLFGLLDEEGQGEISSLKFFRGCTRLRGPAMASDLHHMSVDLTRQTRHTDDLIESVKVTNEGLVDLVEQLANCDTHIIKGEADDKDPVLVARRARARAASRKVEAWPQDDDLGRKPSKGVLRRNSLMGAALRVASAEIMAHSRQGSKGSKENARRNSKGKHHKHDKHHEEAPAPPPIPKEFAEYKRRATSKQAADHHAKHTVEHGPDGKEKPRHANHKKAETVVDMKLLQH